MSGAETGDDAVRIYIDQGHNPHPYHNTGAEGNGLYEQDLTFRIGCLLAAHLEADGRFEVCLSRPNEDTVLGSDQRSSLQARVDGATAFEADYLISLHINSFSQDSANGIEVFSAGTDRESYALGTSLLQGLVDATDLRDRGMKTDSELYVLANATMPAVLVEMGFISNAEDAALLSAHPERFAQGLYDGIVEHISSPYTKDINFLLWVIGISVTLMIILAVPAVVLKKQSQMKMKVAQDGVKDQAKMI